MARLPSYLEFIRPLVHKFRAFIRSFLGIETAMYESLPSNVSVELPVGEAFQRVMDRICVLESHINWRLYGLPATVGNIKLEQTGILANSLDLENLLRTLRDHLKFNDEVEYLTRTVQQGNNGFIVASESIAKSALIKNFAHIHVLMDTEDLFSLDWQTYDWGNWQKVQAPTLTLLSALNENEKDFIWLSDLAERVHPLKWYLILKHAARVVKPGGHILGVIRGNIQDDPRKHLSPPINLWSNIVPEIKNISQEGIFFKIEV